MTAQIKAFSIFKSSHEGILSKSKGEASRSIVCLRRDLQSDLPRPYATCKFEEDTHEANDEENTNAVVLNDYRYWVNDLNGLTPGFG